MSGWTYIRSEPGLWTVGTRDDNGKFDPESDHGSEREAADRVHFLNGGADEELAAELEDAKDAIERVRALHPVVENPRHGCCAPPTVCQGHPPECGGRDHGAVWATWPCRTIRALDGTE